MSTVPALFRRLVDDAAVFPPGDAPLPDATAAHSRHLAAQHGPVVGRFLCRASQLHELDLPGGATLGVIADHGLEHALTALRQTGRKTDVIEYRVDDAAAVAALPHAQAVAEIPLQPGWQDVVRECAAQRVIAKLRTGGLTADAYPAPRAVAEFIAECVARNVPFKCTAGLHRAVCHTEVDTGAHAHGFLNILVATHAAITGGDVFTALTARDAGDLAAVCWGIDGGAAGAVRRSFVAFGSCSIDEPVADLRALGLLPRETAGSRS
jgi:hypothetical protein